MRGDETHPLPRVVIDTVGYLRVVLRDHGVWAAIFRDHARDLDVIVSAPIVGEILDVLHRSEVRRKFPQSAQVGLELVWGVLESAILVEPAEIPAVCRDPNDDKFLATAVGGQAHYVATEDRDLLDLGKYAEIPIVTGRHLLEILRHRRLEE